MKKALTKEEKSKFVALLGLPESASHEQICEQMRLAHQAQDLLFESKVGGAGREVLDWMSRLLDQKVNRKADAVLFWMFFFDYDFEHKLGFMDAEMATFDKKA